MGTTLFGLVIGDEWNSNLTLEYYWGSCRGYYLRREAFASYYPLVRCRPTILVADSGFGLVAKMWIEPFFAFRQSVVYIQVVLTQ